MVGIVRKFPKVDLTRFTLNFDEAWIELTAPDADVKTDVPPDDEELSPADGELSSIGFTSTSGISMISR